MNTVVLGDLGKYRGESSLKFEQNGYIQLQQNANYRQLSSSGLRLPTGMVAEPNGQNFCRLRRTATVNMEGVISCVFPTFYVGDVGGNVIGEIPYPNDIRVQVGIEPLFEVTDFVTPSTRIVAPAVTIPANSTEPYIVIELDLGATTIPEGQEYGIWTATDGISVPVSEKYTGDANVQIYEAYTNWVTDNFIDTDYIETTGRIYANPVGSRYSSIAPVALMCVSSSGKQKPSWGVVGDSIAFGVYDLKGPSGNHRGDQYGNTGWCSRLISGKHKFPNLNLSRGSDAMRYAKNSFSKRSSILAYCNLDRILFEYGVNDTFFGNSFSGMESDRDSLISVIRDNNPNTPLTGIAITPRSSSTDAWATIANQTGLSTTTGNSSMRGEWNNAIRAGNMSSVFDSWLDPCSVIEYNYLTNDSKWDDGDASEPPSTYTEDGLHPTWDCAELLQNNLTLPETVVEELTLNCLPIKTGTTEYLLTGAGELILSSSTDSVTLRIKDANNNDQYYSFSDVVVGLDTEIKVENTLDSVTGYINGVQKFRQTVGYKRIEPQIIFSSLNLANKASGQVYKYSSLHYSYDVNLMEWGSSVFKSDPIGNDGTIVNGQWWKKDVDQNFDGVDAPQDYKDSLNPPPLTEEQKAIYTDATPYYGSDDPFWNPYNQDATYSFTVVQQLIGGSFQFDFNFNF